MLQCQKYIGRIELCSILLESADLAQVKEKFTARAVFQAEVQLALSLESVVHFDDKLIVNAFLFEAGTTAYQLEYINWISQNK